VYFSRLPRPLSSTLFPYTTLFRSSSMPIADNAIYHLAGALDRIGKFGFPLKTNEVTRASFAALAKIETGPRKADLARVAEGAPRSEEHTSELQSHLNLVCRLLLEK